MHPPLPAVQAPTDEDIRAAANSLGMDLPDEAFADYRELVVDTVALLDQLPDFEIGDRSGLNERETKQGPSTDEDPFNAFVTRFRLDGHKHGLLSGFTVGVKDNIAIAGLPMTAGSELLDGYRPRSDATAVSYLLDAGATLTGKLNMDAFAFTGTGETALGGPVLNPRDPNRLAGGSSGGPAAAVAAGEVDIALGTDAGGSIRRPAAACGCVGLKPTYGLVPVSGVIPTCPSLDHVGPITRTVGTCALALDVLAAPGRRGTRSAGAVPDSYVDVLGDGDTPVIGVLSEGFSVDSRTNRVVRETLEQLPEAGIETREVSIPLHERAKAIWSATFLEEATATIRSGAVGAGLEGGTAAHLAETVAAIRRAAPEDLPPTLLVTLLAGQYLTDAYYGLVYATAQRYRETLRAAYDGAFNDVDVLALPTVQRPADPVQDDSSLGVSVLRGTSRTDPGVQNRAPFNTTGHPALTVPCGTVGGLPVGLMLVGARFDELAVLDSANAVEKAIAFEG